MKTTQENLIGKRVRVNIKDKNSYTSDLYKSIQMQEGEIIKKQGEFSSYKNAWLVKFGETALKKYQKTHSGQWSHAHIMEWWTERENFEVLN